RQALGRAATRRTLNFHSVSAVFLACLLSQARPDQLLHRGGRQRFVQGEADGAFGCGEVLKFVFEGGHHGQTHGEQTAVVRKRGESQECAFVSESGNPIADVLGGLGRDDGANRRANFV